MNSAVAGRSCYRVKPRAPPGLVLKAVKAVDAAECSNSKALGSGVQTLINCAYLARFSTDSECQGGKPFFNYDATNMVCECCTATKPSNEDNYQSSPNKNLYKAEFVSFKEEPGTCVREGESSPETTYRIGSSINLSNKRECTELCAENAECVAAALDHSDNCQMLRVDPAGKYVGETY